MSAEASAGDEGRARRVPEEGSLLHVRPEELVGRLVELGYTGRCLFYVGALEGEVGLVEGDIVDARALGDFGQAALFRMLGASGGSYRLDGRATESAPPQAFGTWSELQERYREHRATLARAAEAVGGLEQVWSVRPLILKRHLSELPDQINPLLRRVDGRRTVAQVITETPLEEPLTVRALARLLSLGVLALPDVVADESGPQRSPLSTSLTPEAAEEESEPVPVIGSDLPVRRDWFEDDERLAQEREEERSAVMSGTLPSALEKEAREASALDDDVIPPSDPDGEPADDSLDEPLRPLPPPPDLVEAAGQEGQPSGVAVTTWSSQGEPPPVFETISSDDDREEIDRWLGQERSFFATPPLEVEPEEPPNKALELPREPAAWQKALAAAAFLVVGALVGYVVGQGCSSAPAGAPELIVD